MLSTSSNSSPPRRWRRYGANRERSNTTGFFSGDGAQCIVREAYASSDAFLAHLGGAGPLLARLVELGGGLELDVFGEPSAALRAAVAAFQPRIYSYSQGK